MLFLRSTIFRLYHIKFSFYFSSSSSSSSCSSSSSSCCSSSSCSSSSSSGQDSVQESKTCPARGDEVIAL